MSVVEGIVFEESMKWRIELPTPSVAGSFSVITLFLSFLLLSISNTDQ